MEIKVIENVKYEWESIFSSRYNHTFYILEIIHELILFIYIKEQPIIFLLIITCIQISTDNDHDITHNLF